jgi:hypothetical protein
MAEESKAGLAWLERFQGIAAEEGLFTAPLAVAERVSRLAGEAARGLPFGAEPPDFARMLEALAPKEAARGE